MSNESINSVEIACQNEYDTLRKVIVCEPKFMTSAIQKHNQDGDIKIEQAIDQHHVFVAKMRAEGIDVITLPPNKLYPEQVFTRDIGFTMGHQLFISNMGSSSRQGEEMVLVKWLEKQRLPFQKISKNHIEGGDVLIDSKTIFVGVSSRTSLQAIAQLQIELPTYEVVPIPFNSKYLHLDCVFNILSPTQALIFPPAFNPETLEFLSKRYQLIEVSEEEQNTAGTNVLSIGHKKLFSLASNTQVNGNMRANGYEVIEVDFSEIIKAEGAFRCCTLPIERR